MAIQPEILQSYEQQPQDKVDDLLANGFRFDLSGHQLIDPTTRFGRVVGIAENCTDQTMAGELLPKGVTVSEILVQDPFIASDLSGYLKVRDYIEGMELHLLKDGYDIFGKRNEATRPEKYLPYTSAWTSGSPTEGVALWRQLVPTARALGYLTHPFDVIEGVKVSPEVSAQWRFSEDGIAIRVRAAAMQHITQDYLRRLPKGYEAKWLSLASGTAEPSIAAAKASAEESGTIIDLTVADIDPESLKMVANNAVELGFDGNVFPVEADILEQGIKDQLEALTGNTDGYDVIELLGFNEYLPEKLHDVDSLKQIGTRRGKRLVAASEFNRRAYKMLKPGGIMISGNMILDRPQLGFVFGIVDWPLINARSEEAILQIYENAGILNDPDAQIDMFRVRNADTGSHLYNIVRITKAA